jgi:hypothetical protein
MTFRAAVASLALMPLLLAACGGEVAERCQLSTGTIPSDTLVGAEIDGAPFLVASGRGDSRIGVWHSDTVSEYDHLRVTGLLRRFNQVVSVDVELEGYAGVGGYALGWSEARGSWGGSYLCFEDGGPLTVYYRSKGAAGDSIWVTAFDTLTAVMEGRFQFAAENEDGEVVQVTKGRFKGLIQPSN